MSGVDPKISLNGSLIYLSDPILTDLSSKTVKKTGKNPRRGAGDFLQGDSQFSIEKLELKNSLDHLKFFRTEFSPFPNFSKE